VLTPWQERPLADLLAEHDLAGYPEFPFSTDGWSGARFSVVDRATDQLVLKRTSLAIDWIAAATLDTSIREASLAVATAGADVPGPWASLGAAADGDAAVILMPDLSVELISWDRPGQAGAIPLDDLDRVLRALAGLHGTSWPDAVEASVGSFGWCPLAMCRAGSPAESRRPSACWPAGTRLTGRRRAPRAT